MPNVPAKIAILPSACAVLVVVEPGHDNFRKQQGIGQSVGDVIHLGLVGFKLVASGVADFRTAKPPPTRADQIVAKCYIAIADQIIGPRRNITGLVGPHRPWPIAGAGKNRQGILGDSQSWGVVPVGIQVVTSYEIPLFEVGHDKRGPILAVGNDLGEKREHLVRVVEIVKRQPPTV